MSKYHFLSAVAALSLLSACEPPSNGYYDEHGNFVYTDTPHNVREQSHAPLPAGSYPNYRTTPPYADEFHYDRPGYYDYQGYYVERRDNLRVPEDMLPPRGMCRVWFVNRVPEDQPGIESCRNIHYRVPEGAFVIYGG